MQDEKLHEYRHLIWEQIDWSTVESRLAKYEHIAKYYPFDLISKDEYKKKEPYYCHQLAWRLGVWNGDQAFEHLDNLIAHAETIPGWRKGICKAKDARYEVYFGLLWELQVAGILSSLDGIDIKWLPEGPDLQAKLNSQVFYVECSTYQKSFTIEAFLDDVLRHRFFDVRVRHDRCAKFSLTKIDKLADSLEALLIPLMEESYVDRIRKKVTPGQAVQIPVPIEFENLYVLFEYIDTPGYRNFDSLTANNFGYLSDYLQIMLGEIARSKAGKNRLIENRPNIVMFNIGLDHDLQMAIESTNDLNDRIRKLQLPEDIDALLIATFGNKSLQSYQPNSLRVDDRRLDPLAQSLSRILGINRE